MQLKKIATLLVSAVFLAYGVHAQQTLTGQVTSEGRPLPGATVALAGGGPAASTITDEQGRFALENVPPGPATLEVRLFGFASKKLEVKSGERAQPLAITLELQAYRPPAAQQAQGRVGRNGNGAAFQNVQVMQSLESRVANSLEAQPTAGVESMGEQGTESFLVQGSMSGGLDRKVTVGMFPGMLGPGMGGGMEEGQPGAPGFGGNSEDTANSEGTVGGPGGGFGGRGGGFRGGEGGGFGGRGGGGPGARGDMQQRMVNMSPEERQKFMEQMRQRVAQRGGEQAVFGNRSRRSARDSIRGGVNVTFRNSAFDAAPFSVNGQPIQKPSYAQVRYGASLGGQLRIPKILEKEGGYFFLNYGGSRSRNPYSQFAVMPDEAQRAGDLSVTNGLKPTTIFDPASGLPFPNNTIPSTRIDSAALGLLKLLPLPNQPGQRQNYSFVSAVPSDSDNLSARIMESVSRKDRLTAAIGWQQRSGQSLQLYGFRDTTDGSGRSFTVAWVHNFSARIINNVNAGYNLNRNQVSPYFAYGADISRQLGIAGNSQTPVNYGPPNLNFTNYGDLNDSGHSLRRNITFTFSDGLTMVEGRHTWRVGAQVRRVRWNNLAEQNARGTFFFSGLATSELNAQGLVVPNTGYDFADFLLGYPNQSTIRYNGADTYLRSTALSFYGQDQWRLRSNLTFNLGLRYEYTQPFVEKYNRMANLDLNPTFTAASVVTPGSNGPYSGPIPSGLIDPDRNNFSPRLGLAWRPSQKQHIIVRTGYSIFYDGGVFNRIPSQLVAQPPFATTATFNTSTANVLMLEDGFIGAPNLTITNTYAVNPHYPVPYAQTWNAAVQKEFGRGFIIEGAYLGTKGTRLSTLRIPNSAPPGSPATSEERRQINNAVAFAYDSPDGNSVYHAAQLRFSRRFRRGISFNALYTFSKSIDNAATFGGSGGVVAQDPNNLSAERALSSFDHRHQFSFQGMFSSPVGVGRQRIHHRWLEDALKEWSATWNVTAQTGAPLTARVLGTAADSAGTGTIGSTRAAATGEPIQGGSGYFNLLAFAIPAAGHYGNAGRNTIPGPGSFSVNAGLSRSFQIGDSTRHRIEVSGQANNLTNHVNITSYGTVVNSANYGLASNAGGMRSISLSLRLRF
jgi:hypothetical protein